MFVQIAWCIGQAAVTCDLKLPGVVLSALCLIRRVKIYVNRRRLIG